MTEAGTGVLAGLPEPLAEIVADFQALQQRDRLQLLLEIGGELPELPARYAEHRDRMEPVLECQSPVFLAVEVAPGGDLAERIVQVFLDAPAEAPTTRGFAAILAGGLSGLPAAQILAVPDDMPNRLGLTEAVSPLRLRGLAGMLARIKRQIRDRAAATA